MICLLIGSFMIKIYMKNSGRKCIAYGDKPSHVMAFMIGVFLIIHIFPKVIMT